MDSVELIALAIGGSVIVLAVALLFVLPALGGERRLGGKESDYAGNQPTAGGEGGD